MPDVPVSLTPWFDAKDNPPGKGKVQGRAVIVGRARRGGVGGIEWCDEDGAYQWPKDTVAWSELPSPPDMSDPLTVEDLRRVANYVDGTDRASHDAAQAAAVRLRRALDQIQKGGA